jgi:serine/threonine protein phosphatase 1
MAGRTFAIGDIHGELEHLFLLLSRLPPLDAQDTLVFLGDYVDRGPKSAQVVDYLKNTLPTQTQAKIVALRGNHEDAWLRIVEIGWPEFVMPVGNGCLPTLRSFTGGPVPGEFEFASSVEEGELLFSGKFLPKDVIEWFNTLPYWHEDEHAIYVHAGLPMLDNVWPHPSELTDLSPLLWSRHWEFFKSYRGKCVVFGHTGPEYLPQALSRYTPEDHTDLFAGENCIGVDTGCGTGGFLTAIELPELRVYESR